MKLLHKISGSKWRRFAWRTARPRARVRQAISLKAMTGYLFAREAEVISKIDMKQSGERHDFASDNTAGICPEAFAALEEANANDAPSYGEDRWTARICDRVCELFETDCDVHLVFNGTAANRVALAQLCQSFESVVCHEYAHIQTDECGAPEFFTKGSKLLLISGANEKIDIGQAEAVIARQNELHSHKPH